jgi:molecular chaperone DnaK
MAGAVTHSFGSVTLPGKGFQFPWKDLPTHLMQNTKLTPFRLGRADTARATVKGAAEDKKKQELIEARNIADTMVYTTEKMMKEVEEKKIAITDDEKNKINENLKIVKEVKDKDDVELIKKASEELSKVAQAVGAKMYQAGQAGAQPGADQAASGAEEKKDDNGQQGPIEGEVVK